jgi:carboxymethylenebutenolidase
MTDIPIPARDGSATFTGYLARPAGGTGPGLVLIQYVCGVNQVMRRYADGYAAMGYCVLVPDLFWRQEAGVQLIPDPARPSKEEFARALELNAGIDDALAVEDLLAAADVLRAHGACTGPVGALGYCLGGRLVVPMATQGDLACAVSYYGVNLDRYIDAAADASCPMLFHVAGEDSMVPDTVRRAIKERMAGRADCTVTLHAGVDHAFALPSGPNYNPDAAIAANAQSAAFLARHMPVAS